MGCLYAKAALVRKSNDENIDSARQDLVPYQLSAESISYYHDILPPPLPPPLQRPLILIPPQNQSRIQLHTPIYVALRSHSTRENGYLSFEKDDEMELIEELPSDELMVNHLRSNGIGIIQKKFVKLDPTTPLRLAINDRGITNRCIMQYDVLGAYLIRRSKEKYYEFCLKYSSSK